MKNRWFAFYFAVIFLLSISGTTAAGLKLYSYKDSRGQTVIVGSLERVPEEFRDQVREEYIPTFSNPEKKEESENITILEAEPSDSEDETIESKEEQTAVIVAPPEEDRSAEIASASAFMAQIEKIQFNNKRIHVVSIAVDQMSPVITHLHLENVANMQKLSELNNFEWKNGAAWKASALRLISQMKILQYTITKWIRDGGQGLRDGLPTFLRKISILIHGVKQDLSLAIDAENLGDKKN